MRLIFVVLALFPACLYGARVAISSITEEKAKEWGSTKDQDEINSITATFKIDQKMEEDSRLCSSTEESGCGMIGEMESEMATIYQKSQEIREGAISPEKLSWYWRPYPIPGQCCYTRRWYVCPYTVSGTNPHTGTWGAWYAVQYPWAGNCQILDYVSCQTGTCRSRCYTEYRTHNILVSTFPVTSWWQYVWALYHRQVFWVYVRVPSGCYCPNTFYPALSADGVVKG